MHRPGRNEGDESRGRYRFAGPEPIEPAGRRRARRAELRRQRLIEGDGDARRNSHECR
jgi:hypothetical protein